MRLCLTICLALLAGCGREAATVHFPADLLQPAPGWLGPAPRTEGQMIDAAVAEKRGRERANAQLEAIGQIVGAVR
jgi:hypothetical protein